MNRRITAALVAALLILAGGCTDGDGEVEDTAEEPASTTVAPAAPSAFDGELVSVLTPAGWSASEHADGDGVVLEGPGATVAITAVPAVLFGPVFLELPSPVDPSALAEIIVPALGAADGVVRGDAEIVDLGDGVRAVTVAVSDPEREGELVLFDLGEGAVAIATAHADNDRYADVRETARATVASFALTASTDELLAALQPPSEEAGQ